MRNMTAADRRNEQINYHIKVGTTLIRITSTNYIHDICAAVAAQGHNPADITLIQPV